MSAAVPALVPLPPPALRLAIDGEALAHNWRALAVLAPGAATGAAVKADGYGLGAGVVVPVLASAGCRDWFVAHWQEVPAVIAHVDPARVHVLHGPITAADAAYARDTGVRPVLNSLAQLALWDEAGGGPCDLMIDTGINRIGLPAADCGHERVQRRRFDLCLSHLASADKDSALNTRQRERFAALGATITADRFSLCNSAGIALGRAWHRDLTRPGLALYGGVPRAELAGVIRQVVRPEAALIQVRTIAAGDSVGYNARFVAPRPMRIGVIALGYADGYLRCWSSPGSGQGGQGTWQGHALPVVGRVSMDMTALDLDAAPDLREGDWITLDYDLPTAAAASGLSQYELLTVLGRRFSRNRA